MSVLRRCSRVPNQMSGVASFVQSWRETLSESNAVPHRLYVTLAGSINETGVEGSFKAPSLSPHHAQFAESLEPRIADLVLALVKVGCITYTSCEGHLLDGTIHEAHVGVLNEPEMGPSPLPWVLETCSAHGLTLYRHRLSDPINAESYETIEFYVKCRSDTSFLDYREIVDNTISTVSGVLIGYPAGFVR